MLTTQTILTGAGALSLAAAISLIYQAFFKPVVEAGLARVSGDAEVQNALERIVICLLGAVCGLVRYALLVTHPSGHDAVVAALLGGAEGLGAILEYHAAGVVPTALTGLLQRSVAPATTPAPAATEIAGPV